MCVLSLYIYLYISVCSIWCLQSHSLIFNISKYLESPVEFFMSVCLRICSQQQQTNVLSKRDYSNRKVNWKELNFCSCLSCVSFSNIYVLMCLCVCVCMLRSTSVSMWLNPPLFHKGSIWNKGSRLNSSISFPFIVVTNIYTFTIIGVEVVVFYLIVSYLFFSHNFFHSFIFCFVYFWMMI